jgi:hypothetical protein
MTMNFYTGKDYQIIDKKFEAIRKYVRMKEHTKTGSRAETFRWMVNKIYELVLEKLEEKKS